MSDLKTYAKEARKRLKNGFWDTTNAERKMIIQNALENGQDVKVVEEKCKRKIENKIKSLQNSNKNSYEEELYKKVCQIMESDTMLMNPLSKLIDHEVYDVLDENNKQSYILKLSEQYVEMKKRYKSEHELSLDMAF